MIGKTHNAYPRIGVCQFHVLEAKEIFEIQTLRALLIMFGVGANLIV